MVGNVYSFGVILLKLLLVLDLLEFMAVVLLMTSVMLQRTEEARIWRRKGQVLGVCGLEKKESNENLLCYT